MEESRLLYVWTPELLSFQINVIHDQLPSPANLRLWGKSNLGLYQLCSHQNCSLLHILNCCSFSQQNGRYNWRVITKLYEQYPGNNSDRTGTIYLLGLVNASDKFYFYDSNPYSRWHNNRDPALLAKRSGQQHSNNSDWIFLMDEEHTQVIFLHR